MGMASSGGGDCRLQMELELGVHGYNVGGASTVAELIMWMQLHVINILIQAQITVGPFHRSIATLAIL